MDLQRAHLTPPEEVAEPLPSDALTTPRTALFAARPRAGEGSRQVFDALTRLREPPPGRGSDASDGEADEHEHPYAPAVSARAPG
jgi:hypothetical protein